MPCSCTSCTQRFALWRSGRGTDRLNFLLAVLLSGTGALWALAGQPPGHGPDSQPDGQACPDGKAQPPGARRWHGPGRPTSRHTPHELRALFEPSPEDHGPPRPGELQELRQFVQSCLPELDRTLARLESRGPRAYERGLHRLLPHLRHLRRLHEEDPRLAGLVSRHAQNLFQVERLRRSWQQAADQTVKAGIEDELRSRVSDNLRVEIEALRAWADRLAQERDQRVQARLEALTAADADLSAEAPRVRELVRALSAAAEEAERQRLCGVLTQLLSEQLERRIASLRSRAAQLEGDVEQEVDRRVERLLWGPRPPVLP
jgi:hypothetical protein